MEIFTRENGVRMLGTDMVAIGSVTAMKTCPVLSKTVSAIATMASGKTITFRAKVGAEALRDARSL